MAPPSQRRTPRGGPGGSTRPGTRSGVERGASRARSAGSRPAVASSQPTGAGSGGPRRPRLTGRAAVLVLVLAVLTVSYASSLRAYLQQRSHIDDLKTAIAEREASINALEREKRRWQDPAFVRAQARARFGYLMPGETGFLVLDENGDPLETRVSLSDPDDRASVPTAWWSQAWASVELAGNPPAPSEGPALEIDGVKKQ
ncbi:septum formation initiator family protein [Nocardioides piscis]|uniref:Septum formation initiator family protein n=1 Tax=Nocardioides piscis TaxID=2714938 RepID=A0A6G7YC55_9ACTN|nr:septum formation initiator family protein [Nocardioides piscis]